MKLLVVSPYLPSPTWGAGIRNYYLLKALASKHTVSLLLLADANRIEASDLSELKGFMKTLQVIPRSALLSKRSQQLIDVLHGKSHILSTNIVKEVQGALDALLAGERYDIVFFESVTMAGYRLPKDVHVVIDQHNIEYELRHRMFQRETDWSRKWYNWLESRLIKPVELERCRQANVVLVTSERERLLLKQMLPHGVIEVIPNGVDTKIFHKTQHEQEIPGRVVFTGTMDYYPNKEAVLFFAERCWPLILAQVPDATWQIVGAYPPPEVQRLAELPGVTVTGAVPDVRPYLVASSVVIAPIRVGSGTRLKILEALAMQKGLVSTSIGCEGLDVISGEHLLVADQPHAFADAVITLMRDVKMRRSLGRAGRSLVKATYSWERCGERLLHTLQRGA